MITNPDKQFDSFEDYLDCEIKGDCLCELFNGRLIELPPESGRNVRIAMFLLLQFARWLDFDLIRGHGLELEVEGEPKNRFPDLTIIREEHVELLERRNTIRLTMPPPRLVVEVVSPGKIQYERDYVAKRFQYQQIGVEEYWLVDPESAIVTILVLNEGVYQFRCICQGDLNLESSQFPQMNYLTAGEILAGRKK